ncbi:AAA domain-containing protein [Reinekea sp.]|jgi:DNA replication ATP-dependent helicase Dna2|uniref:AAA domain-containing protein n=1 Tax=Reinekea sp. TaxID=1970455 RepID=UPI0039894BB8
MSLQTVFKNLVDFVYQEQDANFEKLREVWSKPLAEKINSGETQQLIAVKVENASTVVVTLGENESRFREGDMVRIHTGDPVQGVLLKQASIEAEYDGEWLLRAEDVDVQTLRAASGDLYIDVDGMDLTPFFEKALNDIADKEIGQKILLPMLAGQLNLDAFDEPLFETIGDIAENEGLNEKQADAVGYALAAHIACCIQGPPGTGKTKVISLITRLLVERGSKVFVTSHTHMAINNALNKIASEGVPVVKVGAPNTKKGLDNSVTLFGKLEDWQDRPDNGYVVGATPFATCTSRMENYEFDVVIFDEASQITAPLALMAMRKARRYIFVGDHKQLPPVVLSKSVISGESHSIFSKLTDLAKKTNVMLSQTYRMNTAISKWPSIEYYAGKLVSAGDNKNRQFQLEHEPSYEFLKTNAADIAFIESPGVNCRVENHLEAELVVNIIIDAVKAGLAEHEIGVVTPYRKHARRIRSLLKSALKREGLPVRSKVVVDTVERMQGQEREMVVVSMCSNEALFMKNIATFFFQAERLNVSISRAKTKLVFIGPKISRAIQFNADEVVVENLVNSYKSFIESASEYEVY